MTEQEQAVAIVDQQTGKEEEDGAVDVGKGKAASRWTLLRSGKKFRHTLRGDTIRIEQRLTAGKFEALVRTPKTRVMAKLKDGRVLDLSWEGPYTSLQEAYEDAEDRIVCAAFLVKLLNSVLGREEDTSEEEDWEEDTLEMQV